MLGIGGKFAGAKGMVQMPDLANLNPEQANALLTINGLKTRNQNSNDTTDSGLNNKVFNQSITAGQLVDYETEIDFSYYIYVAPAVVITYGTAEQYDSNTEVGCNQSPNNQSSSNQYYYCTRVTRYYRSKKYEDGVWYGEYGQYSSSTDVNWNCTIVPNQCGNTESSRVKISEGTCQPNNTKSVTYRVTYAAGNTQNITVTEACVYNPVTEVNRTVSRGSCGSPGGGGCKCGQRSVTTTIYYSDGTQTTSSSTECCPDSTSCSNTATYWFSCGAFEPNKKRWTYRTVCTDCVGNVVSDTRTSDDIACCTASCGTWSAWIKVATWVESRTRTCTRDDCSTYTETETRCIQHCDIWRTVSGCLGTYKIQQRKCQASDCSYYYETRNVAC